MDSSTCTLILPGEPRMIAILRRFVEAVGVTHRFAKPLIHSLVLVSGEAFHNILRHGHRDLPGAEVELRICFDGDCVCLTFLDQGRPFDLDSVPHLDPAELREGGRGVFLMRRVMDEVTCCRREDERPGNALRMVKRVPTHEPQRCAS